MQLPYGLGRHNDTISAQDKVAFTQLSFIQSIVPLMGGIAFLKIAIALELMKLKGIALAWYHTILWFLIGELLLCLRPGFIPRLYHPNN